MRQLSWLAKQLKDNAPQEREEELPKPTSATITTPVAPVQPQPEAPPSSGSPSAPGNPDPRPDLSADHVLWVTLLFVARRVDPYIRGLLWCTRYLGAGAEYDGKTIRIVPGQVSQEDYAQIRAEWMQPHRERIVRILEEAVKTLQGAGVMGAIGAASKAKEVKTGMGQAETGQAETRPPGGLVWRPPAQEVKEPQIVQKTLGL